MTDLSLLGTLPGVVDEYISSGNHGPDSTEGWGKLKVDQWREAIDFSEYVSSLSWFCDNELKVNWMDNIRNLISRLLLRRNA